MKSQAFDRRSHLIGDIQGFRYPKAAQQYGKFLAANARDKVSGAQGGRETRGDALQDAVARSMSVAVVDDLETVDVPQQQNRGRRTLRAPRDFLGETLVEGFSIGDARQGIESRAVFLLIQFEMQLLRFTFEVRDAHLHSVAPLTSSVSSRTSNITVSSSERVSSK